MFIFAISQSYIKLNFFIVDNDKKSFIKKVVRYIETDKEFKNAHNIKSCDIYVKTQLKKLNNNVYKAVSNAYYRNGVIYAYEFIKPEYLNDIKLYKEIKRYINIQNILK